MMPLDPRRRLHQQREAGGVTFGETVFPEAADLRETILGELRLVSPLRHSFDKSLMKLFDTAGTLPRRHRTAQLIRLIWRETRGDDRQSHRLLLKQRHAQR